MKYGIKLWSTNTELIKQAQKYYLQKNFDYIELSSIIGTFDKNLLKYLKKIPCIIHLDNNNVNLAKKEFEINNIKAIEEGIKFANYLNAKYIIVHPGYNGSINNSLRLLNKYKDKRFCIENMPGKTIIAPIEKCEGKTFEELIKFKDYDFCLDFAHAIKASNTLNIDPYKLIKKLLQLNNVIFHISDGIINDEQDNHLNIGKGNFDFNHIFSLLNENDLKKYITLETPKENYNNLNQDIKNIKLIKKIIHSLE